MTHRIDGLNAARKTAQRLVPFTEIRDVRLWKSSTSTLSFPNAGEFSYSIEYSPRVEFSEGATSFVTHVSYTVTIADESLASEAREDPADTRIAHIEFELAALFALDLAGAEGPTYEELQAYSISTGQFALWPFARAFVYDISARMGLPPLSIGVLRLGFARPPAADSSELDSGEPVIDAQLGLPQNTPKVAAPDAGRTQ